MFCMSHDTPLCMSPYPELPLPCLGETDETVVYPPNGIIPFHGFSLFIAPMCFIWSDPVILYNVFKALYTRFFFRLHSLSSHPQGEINVRF